MPSTCPASPMRRASSGDREAGTKADLEDLVGGLHIE
jgi:hypothetical protein